MAQAIPKTSIIILGVTGDLTAKKIMPALFNLWKKGELPLDTNIIGFGRRELSNEQFLQYAKEILSKKINLDDTEFDQFSEKLSYVQGLFDFGDSYTKLSEHLDNLEAGSQDSQRLFYLAVPPEIYGTIFTHLDETKLGHGGPNKILTKILVEKPFGNNLETAENLDKLLGTLFAEHQIYRIDHYLAKEMIQNILTFRFSNDIFESIWSNQHIEKIEIRTWETLGVESRGAFYDSVGTLRDVGQNHLLQMLALMTMDAPLDYSSQAVQLRRAQILNTLQPLNPEQIKTQTFRAQYSGFNKIDGVKLNSQTETYFKLVAELGSERWVGVPIFMEAGKRLSQQIKDVVVTFKSQPNTVRQNVTAAPNRIIFSLEPTESISLEFWAKKPGLTNETELRTMDFTLRGAGQSVQYVEEYEKLLIDAVRGDQTLFVSTSEVKSMWAFIDPIVRAWADGVVPLNLYEPDTQPQSNELTGVVL